MSLFARVYVFALGIAAAWAAVAAAVLGGVMVPAQDADSVQGIRWASEQLLRLRSDPAALAAAVGSLRSDAGVELTLYGPAGEVVTSNVDPPLSATASGEPWVVQVDGGFVAVGQDLEPIDLRIGLGGVVGVLVALGIVAWPLARSVTRPLAHLGDAVERFGRGDLDARVGVVGRDEIGQLGARFDQMAERIAALLADERLWMAGLSHEFRTPLHRLRLALDNAEDAGGQVPPGELAAIRDDVAELDELVADVLAAARLLAAPPAAPSPRRERVDLVDVVRTACARAGVTPPELGPVWVDGDRRLLIRAVLNLVRNAQEHAVGVTVEVEHTAERAAVRVTDRGPGIPAPHRAGVWAPYARGALAPQPGRGLGLALVRRVAETHGGRASLTDAAPGSVFVLELPVASVER